MEINPQELSARDRYKLLIGCIVPRPIAVVSTISPDGAPNLAPFSFFNGVGSDPMLLMFCPANKPDGAEKDTLRNAKPLEEGGTGEFVVNIATERYAAQVAGAAEPLDYGRSEFEFTGLETEPSVVVRPPRVGAAAVAFECRTVQVIRTNPGAPGGGNIVIGEVVHLCVDDDVIDEDRMHINHDTLQAIGRMGGIEYCRTSLRFEMPFGRAALEAP